MPVTARPTPTAKVPSGNGLRSRRVASTVRPPSDPAPHEAPVRGHDPIERAHEVGEADVLRVQVGGVEVDQLLLAPHPSSGERAPAPLQPREVPEEPPVAGELLLQPPLLGGVDEDPQLEPEEQGQA